MHLLVIEGSSWASQALVGDGVPEVGGSTGDARHTTPVWGGGRTHAFAKASIVGLPIVAGGDFRDAR